MKNTEKNNTGPHLELSVDGEYWKRVPDFNTTGPEDRVYTLGSETGTVRFGDGVRGARPPIGSNVMAEYRYGGGTEGNVANGPVITLTWKPEHLSNKQVIGAVVNLSLESILFNAIKKCRKLTIADLVLSVLPWPFHKDLPPDYCGKRPGIRFKDLVLLVLCKSVQTSVVFPTPKKIPRPRTWRVRRGDTLEGIAAEVYRDPTMWREIARRNDIEDPRLLTPGTILTLPEIDE